MSAKAVAVIGFLIGFVLLGIATGLELYLRSTRQEEHRNEPIHADVERKRLLAKKLADAKSLDRTFDEAIKEAKHNSLKPVSIDRIEDLDFDVNDAERTFKWIVQLDKRIEQARSKKNAYLIEEAEQKRTTALNATAGKHFQWKLKVERIDLDSVVVEQFADGPAYKDLVFFINQGTKPDCRPGNTKLLKTPATDAEIKEYGKLTWANHYWMEDEESKSLLRKLVSGDLITLSGAIHSFEPRVPGGSGDISGRIHYGFILVDVKLICPR